MQRKTSLRAVFTTTLLLSLLAVIPTSDAGMPVARNFPEGSAHLPNAARGRVTVKAAEDLRDIQQAAGVRQAGAPRIATQAGQRVATIEQRADMRTLLDGMRRREGAGATRKMEVMSMRRAKEYERVGELPVELESGVVALEQDVIQVVMPNKTVVRMKLEVTGPQQPSVAELQDAMQQLPAIVARDSRIPDQMIYQAGNFSVGTEGSSAVFRLQPLSDRDRQGQDSRYAQR